MICPQCGKNNLPGARFCSNCRYSFEDYGQPGFDPWQQNWYQEEDYGRKEKKNTGLKILIGVEAVFLVLLAGIFWYAGRRLTGPEQTLEKYWEARSEGRWEQVYACSDFPSSDLLTAQMLVDASRNQGTVVSWEETDCREEEDRWIYTVEYQLDDGTETQWYETEVTVLSVGRKWGIFQNWKVSGDRFLVRDCTFYLPSGSQMYLNGEKVEMEEDNGEEGTLAVEIPWIFEGDYQLRVTKEGMETYQTNLTLDGGQENYQYEVMMRPARQLEAELVEKSGAALQLILQNALGGNDFDAVSSLFAQEAVESGEAAEEYNAIRAVRSDGRGEGVTFLEIYNLEGQIAAQPAEAEGLCMKMQGNAKKRYTAEFMGRLHQEISEGALRLDFEYVQEGDQWKLVRMPVTEEDIRSI